MTITINDDCSIMTVVSEEGIISDIVSPESTDCCITLELGTNCCTPTLSTSLPMLYDFDYEVTACEINEDLDPEGFTLTISITGIDADCVSSFSYPSTNSTTITTETNPTDLIFTYAFNAFLPNGDINFEVNIITCGGLTYLLQFTINALAGCGGLVLGALVPTYPLPSVPAGVTIVGINTFEILPEAFGISGSTFPDGIYYVGLTENTTTTTISESDTIFVDCQTTCRVIDVLANDLCSDIYLLLDALKYSFNCDTITYEQQCDLWFVIAKQLGYFINTPCSEPKTSCGTCNK